MLSKSNIKKLKIHLSEYKYREFDIDLILARFAIQNGLTRKKVRAYYEAIQKA